MQGKPTQEQSLSEKSTDAVIRIKNLRLRTYIGFNEEEMKNTQDVVINVEIHYPASQA
ncbi:MAG: dihydroneopterin aldolase, partial [Plesiomonas shigelloides]